MENKKDIENLIGDDNISDFICVNPDNVEQTQSMQNFATERMHKDHCERAIDIFNDNDGVEPNSTIKLLFDLMLPNHKLNKLSVNDKMVRLYTNAIFADDQLNELINTFNPEEDKIVDIINVINNMVIGSMSTVLALFVYNRLMFNKKNIEDMITCVHHKIINKLKSDYKIDTSNFVFDEEEFKPYLDETIERIFMSVFANDGIIISAGVNKFINSSVEDIKTAITQYEIPSIYVLRDNEEDSEELLFIAKQMFNLKLTESLHMLSMRKMENVSPLLANKPDIGKIDDNDVAQTTTNIIAHIINSVVNMLSVTGFEPMIEDVNKYVKRLMDIVSGTIGEDGEDNPSYAMYHEMITGTFKDVFVIL